MLIPAKGDIVQLVNGDRYPGEVIDGYLNILENFLKHTGEAAEELGS